MRSPLRERGKEDTLAKKYKSTHLDPIPSGGGGVINLVAFTKELSEKKGRETILNYLSAVTSKENPRLFGGRKAPKGEGPLYPRNERR